MVRAFVCGCLGPALSGDERAFLKEAAPLGVILFKRNVVDPEQVRALTSEIRAALGRDDAMVLVDQEGGRVQRLGPPGWRRYPAAARFSIIADEIERARAMGLPYVYLGYWVPESRKMAYKARFRPSEILAGGTWRVLTDTDLGSQPCLSAAELVPASAG